MIAPTWRLVRKLAMGTAAVVLLLSAAVGGVHDVTHLEQAARRTYLGTGQVHELEQRTAAEAVQLSVLGRVDERQQLRFERMEQEYQRAARVARASVLVESGLKLAAVLLGAFVLLTAFGASHAPLFVLMLGLAFNDLQATGRLFGMTDVLARAATLADMLFISVAFAFCTAFPQRWTPDRAAGGGRGRVVRRLIHIASRPLTPWLLAGTLAVLALPDWTAITRNPAMGTVLHDLAPGALVILAVVVVAAVLRARYADADAAARRALMWMAQGFAFLAAGAVAGVVLGVVLLLRAGWSGDAAGLAATLLFAAGLALFVFSLAGAVLLGGAFDISPVLRRTAVYGVAGLVAISLFAALEAALSSQLAARAGMPAGFAGWMAAVFVALVFAPLRGWAERRLQRSVRTWIVPSIVKP